MILTDSKERTRFIRFALVGGLGALVDFVTFNFLTGVVAVRPVWSAVLSFIVAVISNFTWNRYWTYPESRSKIVARQISEFGLVSVVGLLIRTPVFAFLYPRLSDFFAALPYPSPFSPDFLGHNLALAIAIGVVMFWNFYVNRFWTYGDVE